MEKQEEMSRRERNKMRNRRDILDAALVEFSEKGYHETSIQDIATRAEFALGTIYALFESKEELYRTLILEYAQEAAVVLNEALAEHDDPLDQLLGYVAAKGHLFEDKLELARLIFVETFGPGVNFKSGPNPQLRMMYVKWHERLAQVFAEGMTRGRFRQADPAGLAVALEALSNAFVHQWHENPEAWGPERGVQWIRELLLDPLCTGGEDESG